MRGIVLLSLLAMCARCSDEIKVPEVENDIYVTKISLSADDLVEDKLREIEAIIEPSNATNQNLIWSVSDLNIAEVSDAGVLSAKMNGEVTVTVIAEDQGTVSESITLKITSFEEEEIVIEVNNPFELYAAIDDVRAGDVIWLAGGVYEMTERLDLEISGTSSELIVLKGNPENTERPILDFSEQTENSSNQGIQLKADNWHIIGLDIRKAGDNGMQVRGSNNTIEFCSFYENSDTGLQLDNGAANNLILNCDSYYNADSKIENADGFAAKLTVGDGNQFDGCRAWQNLDDGWDGYLRGADRIETHYINCWAIKNGILKSGEIGGGDGNGFKTGGSDDKNLSHDANFSNCLAVGNTHDGFDHNSNRGAVKLFNCGAYDNGTNYNFSSTNSLLYLEVKNSVAVGSYGSLNATIKSITNNSWQDGLIATADDYIGLDIDELLAPRKDDGTLPDVDFMKLKDSSPLIDKGVDVGLPFNGIAPDIGVFEN